MEQRPASTGIRETIRTRVRSAIGENFFSDFRGVYWSLKLRLTGYEPETRLARRFVPRGGVCIDVGGNFGQFASYLARAAGATGLVHSFEPLEYNRRIFQTVMRLMGLRNVVVHPFAVGSRRELLRVTIPQLNTAEAHISESGEEPVEVVPLDAWAVEAGLTRLDFVKIDVEGFEMEVLRGASNLLSRFTPALLCEISGVSEERYGVAALEPFRFLKNLGYRSYVLGSAELVAVDGPRRDVINYFFVHETKGIPAAS